MKRFPVIISFYTENTPYQMEAHNLVNSCRRFGLEYVVEGIPSFGTWELNCAFKPFFILGKLLERQEPMLWVDCDGVFARAPSVLDVFKADIALRRHDELPLDHPSKVISSTIYINDTPTAQQILRSWAATAKQMLLDSNRKEEFWDQEALAFALANHGAAKVASLPLEYTKIFDHPDDAEIDPVIIHYQASRRFKDIVNSWVN